MKIPFYKYQGAGNDFIMIDNRFLAINHHDPAMIARLCDRRFGVGGDGIMFLQSKDGYDFEMVYYNADGQPSSMCGNGGRCIVAFAKQLGVIDTETDFLAVDGPHHAKISADGNWVSLQMIDVDTVTRDAEAYVLNTGSPHYVTFAKGLTDKNVYNDGYAIRNNETYKVKGINVNFVEPEGEGYFVRTFERGVEDETYACGTGVTAVALAMARDKGQTGTINTPIRVLGGNMNIRFNYDGAKFTNIFLEGPAELVFGGEIELLF
ncbi:diaminopimelate epimerase [Mucilaginibacter myungsuensis]|uniref:Diaminopimelate epimerase n=1 Tax=Mucilaginibacter myungsuensis TaxID=649104 RepID=A0A929KWM4_9SPHI|nr:diaminopimelate epimerase [Mucilaginibacter myungsuensis]MBE9661283.1 diaminopimelate epimerase [Mucilaginibacter myungsuensis]MDN3597426.1 diaminopimelate epimerase [Mucilaginibacter myungsuensis]